MSPGDFDLLARIVRRRAGILLTPDRADMAARRLEPVMRRFDFRTMAGLMAELRLGRAALADAVTEAMLVNESSFFRDVTPFLHFRDRLLPRLMAARAESRRLRLWSAACAAGQEAYSIAILLADLGLARQGWNIELFATDLSFEAIARAEAGRFSTAEMERGLDSQALRWFRRDGEAWVADEALRRMISFRRFNLLDSYGWLDELDVIFCRNVLMYLTPAARRDVLARMAETLAVDGALILGETEMPEDSVFAPDGQGLYVRKGALARAV